MTDYKLRLKYTIGGFTSTTDSNPGISLTDAEQIVGDFVERFKSAIARERAALAAFETQPLRIAKVNELLVAIGDVERGFFKSGERRAEFVFDEKRGVCFRDERRGQLLRFTAARTRPQGFSHGGGLWSFVVSLHTYILRNLPIHPLFGQHWGYSDTEILTLRAKAQELGIAEREEVLF